MLGQLQSTTPSSSRNLVKGQIGKKRLAVTAEDRRGPGFNSAPRRVLHLWVRDPNPRGQGTKEED